MCFFCWLIGRNIKKKNNTYKKKHFGDLLGTCAARDRFCNSFFKHRCSHVLQSSFIAYILQNNLSKLLSPPFGKHCFVILIVLSWGGTSQVNLLALILFKDKWAQEQHAYSCGLKLWSFWLDRRRLRKVQNRTTSFFRTQGCCFAFLERRQKLTSFTDSISNICPRKNL